MSRRRETTHVVVHTSASGLVARRQADLPAAHRGRAVEIAGGRWAVTFDPAVEEIDRMHRQAGYARIGYHWYIRKDGSLHAGRAEHEIGAHCSAQRMNHRAIGVCFAGHHNLEPWTPMQRASWLRLAERLVRTYGIEVACVIGHRETGARKDCPGTAIDMHAVRAELARHLRAPEAAGALLARGSHGPAVLALQRALQSRGLYSGHLDGALGPQTEQAVRTFQRTHGLLVDGVAGPRTHAALGL